MQALELILALFTIILVSSVLDQVMTRLSLPLVQIAMGVVGAIIIGEPFKLTFDSELFLVLFIGPLLYDESQHVLKRALMKNAGAILSLAIGLVVASVFAVGYTLQWIVPTIPLAAGLALGAALGPTDGVAVSALSKSTKLSGRQQALLSGESLINDASGIVSFQFAVGLGVTGIFSVKDAATTFAVSFGGGLAFGVVMGIVVVLIQRAVRGIGMESTVFHVTFEILTPLFINLLAEKLGVSGILAVVAAGLFIALVPTRSTVYAARVSLVSQGVWEVMSFVLNGVVFVFLGSRLPSIIMHSWESTTKPVSLLTAVVALTAVITLLRFVWIFLLDVSARRRNPTSVPASWKDAAVASLATTLGGPKGAVTLSIALTLPHSLVGTDGLHIRDELLFLASGIILCTLLLANFVLPVLAPADDSHDDDRDTEVRVKVKERLIATVGEELGPKHPQAVSFLTARYNREIAELTMGEEFEDAVGKQRLNLLHQQSQHLEEMRQAGQIAESTYAPMKQAQSRLLRGVQEREKPRGKWKRVLLRLARGFRDRFANRTPERRAIVPADIRTARRELARYSLDYLSSLVPDTDAARNAVHFLIAENQRFLLLSDQLQARREEGSSRVMSLAEEQDLLEVEALRLELGCIQELREAGEFTTAEAANLRDEVYLLQMNLSDYGAH